jgi:hypothetical protein
MGNEGCLLKRAFDFKWSLKIILFMEIYARSANFYSFSWCLKKKSKNTDIFDFFKVGFHRDSNPRPNILCTNKPYI